MVQGCTYSTAEESIKRYNRPFLKTVEGERARENCTDKELKVFMLQRGGS